VPWAGVGVVFRIIEGVIGLKHQPRFIAKDRHTFDAAALERDVFFEPPAQPTDEIQLSFRMIIRTVCAGQGVVAGFVQMRVLNADRVGVLP